ncbi:hypothetical protein SNEBB_005724 [Seison nebaliae]|nr:hypothetical protein SNEBB_005724 [Seison nebaliae]
MGIIAIHLGAGTYPQQMMSQYSCLCEEVCQKSREKLVKGEEAIKVAAFAVSLLEDSPLCNAGYGSNCTINGRIECDASVMQGNLFGSVGAVSSIKNPILAALSIADSQRDGLWTMTRVPPCSLVGEQVNEWARDHHIELVKNESLLISNVRQRHKRMLKSMKYIHDIINFYTNNEGDYTYSNQEKYLKESSKDGKNCSFSSPSTTISTSSLSPSSSDSSMEMKFDKRRLKRKFEGKEDKTMKERKLNGINSKKKTLNYNLLSCPSTDLNNNVLENIRLDTVGACVIDENGMAASAISSGGIHLKQPGRIGQAAVYGSGCWSQSHPIPHCYATTGVGEYLIRTLLAKTASDMFTNQMTNANSKSEKFSQIFSNSTTTTSDKCFMKSSTLKDAEDRSFGILGIAECSPFKEYAVTWNFSSKNLLVAYTTTKGKAEVGIHLDTLPESLTPGKDIRSKTLTIRC